MTSPKRPTPEQLKLIAENYSQLRKNIERAAQLVLQVTRHPDATDEHIKEAAQHYRRDYTSLREIHKSCNELNRGSVPSYKPFPWEMPL